MREIKFRVWDKKNSRWFGDTIHDEFCSLIYDFEIAPDKEKFVVMQFTGLTDALLNDIYEGDIIPFRMSWSVATRDECSIINSHEDGTKTYTKIDTVNCVVERNEADGGWKLVCPKYKAEKPFWISHADIRISKIIGNIYKNPELLK